jgi:hypothetical protein
MEFTNRLLSTCVGSFACPGIDTQVQGITDRLLSTCVGSFACPGIRRYKGSRFLVSSDRPSCIHNFFVCALAAGSNPCTDPSRIVSQAC